MKNAAFNVFLLCVLETVGKLLQVIVFLCLYWFLYIIHRHEMLLTILFKGVRFLYESRHKFNRNSTNCMK
jgi:hypothetical protein